MQIGIGESHGVAIRSGRNEMRLRQREAVVTPGCNDVIEVWRGWEVTQVPAIVTYALTKTFRTKVKESGLRGSMSAILRPQYRTVCAVRGIDLEVNKGEVLAFIGPNGAGKSTTIKMLTGILHPTSGSASVLGMDPSRQRRQLAYRIGSVFGQKSQLWFHLPPLGHLPAAGCHL